MIELDGSYGSGGGQILRSALALSLYTGKSFKLKNIRANRPKPGLSFQHLSCVKAAQQFNSCQVKGDALGSRELEFVPGDDFAKRVNIDIGTAGSVTLLLQSLLLPAMLKFNRTTFVVKGGTDVAWSMPADYFANVLLPAFSRFANFDFKLKRRGYYPKGGGEVKLVVKKKEEISKLNLISNGSLVMVKGVSHAAYDLQDSDVAERQVKAAEFLLNPLNVPVNIDVEYCDTLNLGSGISLYAVRSLDKDDVDVFNPIRVGGSALGEKGKKAEHVGKEAAQELLKEISGPVDEFLADNLIPFLGVFGGQMKVTNVSDHTKANIYVVESFLDVKFDVSDDVVSVTSS
jgi:RNA 3'-terminal phosphate cyclase (GTP)